MGSSYATMLNDFQPMRFLPESSLAPRRAIEQFLQISAM
jgi:hypothetical protein